MKTRDFNKLMDKITTPKKGVKWLDEKKIDNLTADEIKAMCFYIVRLRHPVVSFLIPKDQLSWLHSMGYLYSYKNRAGYTFLGTSEHQLKYQA